jgi:hypothetical protein
MKYLHLFAVVLLSTWLSAQTNYTISGTLEDASSGEALIGATIFVPALSKGVNTNVYGFYSITLPEGTYDVSYSFIGLQKVTKSIKLTQNIKMDLGLEPSSIMVREAVVEGTNDAEQNIESVDMSTVNMQMTAIKKIPAFMGEVDIIKAIQLLPGVATVGEGGSGFYVRGGAVDQNLILLDEAAVYNASHLLGFFSVFNSDAIKDVQLYKGGIPARYGGRLSSVLDIHMKDGNNKRFAGTGGIGTVSSRLTLEGPLKKDKGSILFSGRRTYADLFLKLSKNEGQRNTRLYFYDLNLKANYEIGENDRVYLSGYFGRDVFKFADLFGLNWGNTTGTARWNHIYNSKLFSNVSLIYSNFQYGLGQDFEGFGFQWDSEIKDLTGKVDFSYFMNPNNTLGFGVTSTLRNMNPGFARGTGESIFNELKLEEVKAWEHAVYASNEQHITDQLKVQYGLRYSLFQQIGPGTVWSYNSDFEPVDSTYYNPGEKIQQYGGLEPRLGVSYRLNSKSAIKASYNRMYQYIHLASNSTSSSPLDVWFTSGQNIKPQRADQIALGYFRNLKNNAIELSAEVYYKEMTNAIDFKNHAELFLNQHLEGELRFGEARSYGLELLVRKQTGRLTGMIGYTLARTEKSIPDITEGWYPTKYDKTHDVSVVVAYTLSDKWSFGASFVYSTGAAVTLPTGRFTYMGMLVPVYSDRNGARMPAYHRLDLSATLSPKQKKERKWQGEWVFSVYNAYNRHNAYSINFQQEADDPNVSYAVKTYLLPVVPSVTYNFNF